VKKQTSILKRHSGPGHWLRPLLCVLALVLMTAPSLSLHTARAATASTPSIWTQADGIRQVLLQAQLALLDNKPADAKREVAQANLLYAALAPQLSQHAPQASALLRETLSNVTVAATEANIKAFAAGRSAVWAGLLQAGFEGSLHALKQGDIATARDWLLLREFRTSTRFASASADATLALEAALKGERDPAEVLPLLRAELLDTYQFKLHEALLNVAKTDDKRNEISRAEYAGLAHGYFGIVQPAYAQQFGPTQTQHIEAALTTLVRDSLNATANTSVAGALDKVDMLLAGFRAAPLSETERNNRAIKVGRYLSLIAPNYGRGVRDENGTAIISNQIEFDEAVTFRKAAEDAFNDVLPDLQALDAVRTAQFRAQIAALEPMIRSVAAPTQITTAQDALLATWQALVPAEWVQSNPSADFDNIRDMLKNVERAIGAKQYPQAESARLEGYAILDAGPEIRLRGLDPELANELSGLFWQGYNGTPGLLSLISNEADMTAVRATSAKINDALVRAQQLVGSGRVSPQAVIVNAAAIIFRQGLEAVVIVAAIFAGLRKVEDQRHKKPLRIGLVVAGVVTVLTWFAMRGLISQFAQFGERLEAVVSIIGVIVLLTILNWFIHKFYWTDWMSNIHKRKKRGVLSAESAQFLALATVGFTSIYREGFETVLFSQVLVLEAGPTVVLQGLALGAAVVAVIGLIAWRLHNKLPYMQLLWISAVLIGSVLFQMVGQTVHVMQAVRWLPVTALNLPVPYWMGVWFGVYPTLEGLGAQFAAIAFVLGSYFLAERANRKSLKLDKASDAPNKPREEGVVPTPRKLQA